MSLRVNIALVTGALLLLCPPHADGQTTGQLPAVFDGVGLDERLGERVPTDLQFTDDRGQTVQLGDYLNDSRPVLLNFVYHECPMLCSLMLTEFTQTLKELHQTEGWIPGEEFDVLTVSFSATELPDLAARSKERYLKQLGVEEAAAGWHFLTGTDESIMALANSVGFSFKWMEESQEYAHPAALMFLSGSGVITRYIHGMAFATRDVKLAVVEASEGRVGTAMDKIFLYCYRYDSAANSYVADAWIIMRTGGLLTMLLLGGTLIAYWRRERRTLTPVSATPAVGR